MVECEEFRKWLENNTEYSPAVISDNVSRIKRADHILKWSGDEAYLFYLEKEPVFVELSVSVKSQIRKSVKLYAAYIKELTSL
jgi:hypothetical protein